MFYYKPIVFLSVFLFVCHELGRDHRTAAASLRGRCECVSKVDQVPWKRIKKFTVTEGDPLCGETSIILQMKRKNDPPVCLNPESKQGQRLQKCWKKIKKDPARKDVCLKPGRKTKKAKTH
ncbi:chemokine (C-X-C motif) ligand 18a, duplicate 1 [Megalops cyprinoides]|uniref:chemokine (C-X-C motif) ligand 18a, duplicate 1 n=1 Tax=Megalops cyprinoides TaxID=118141 RepID=UPI0018650C3B|nr:chemokine (C-X-C motif) ligand 18a, duplicate 1 [Megalops cyprinoides]